MAERTYAVSWQSTDDPDLDAELILLEDREHTLDEIRAICRRYDVGARVFDGDLVKELRRDGTEGLAGTLTGWSRGEERRAATVPP